MRRPRFITIYPSGLRGFAVYWRKESDDDMKREYVENRTELWAVLKSLFREEQGEEENETQKGPEQD